jgi:hypothetical protein
MKNKMAMQWKPIYLATVLSLRIVKKVFKLSSRKESLILKDINLTFAELKYSNHGIQN